MNSNTESAEAAKEHAMKTRTLKIILLISALAFTVFCAVIALVLWVIFSGNPKAESTAKLANESEEKVGSPYRWTVIDQGRGDAMLVRELLGTSGATATNPQLKSDILGAIGSREMQAGGNQLPEICEYRTLSADFCRTTEIWVVNRGNAKAAYIVKMGTSPQGGTDINITGPWQ